MHRHQANLVIEYWLPNESSDHYLVGYSRIQLLTLESYNLGGWIILYALLKNWVAESVAFDVNNFILELLLEELR